MRKMFANIYQGQWTNQRSASAQNIPVYKEGSVQIVNCNEKANPKLTLNSGALTDVLRKVQDEPVVVLSIAGEYRTGKSFLLNFLIRYLEALERGDTSNWLKDPNVPLKGFDWAPGSDRTTIGIHLWSRPFRITLPDRTRVAVLLMDTQGLFDDKTAPQDAATIFALSTMISSIQVYNVMRNIGEHHLKHLELFVETGCMVLQECSREARTKPFQRLIYLVRDWADVAKHKFGETGGQQYLLEKLMVSGKQPPELRRVRENIHDCFESTECFLMPNPGMRASENYVPDSDSDSNDENNLGFSGKLSEIDKRFRKRLDEIAPFLLEPGRIQLKKYGTQYLTGRVLIDNIVRYLAMFQSGKLPTPSSTKETLVNEFNTMIVTEVVQQFKNRLTRTNPPVDQGLKDPSIFQSGMEKDRKEALDIFQSKARGRMEETSSIRAKLEETLSSLISKKMADWTKAFLQKKEQDEQQCRYHFNEAKDAYEMTMKRGKSLMKREELDVLHGETRRKVAMDFRRALRGLLVKEEEHISSLNDNLEQMFDRLASLNEAKWVEMKYKEAHCANAVSQAEMNYRHAMKQICGTGMGYVDPETLGHTHEREQQMVLEIYERSTNMHPEYASKFRKALVQNIQILYTSYTKKNERNRRQQRESEIYCQQQSEDAIEKYQLLMDKKCEQGPRNIDSLHTDHTSAVKTALTLYRQRTSQHGAVRQEFEDELNCQLQELFEKYQKKNDIAIALKEKQMAETRTLKSQVVAQLQIDYEQMCDATFKSTTKIDQFNLKITHPAYRELPMHMQSEVDALLLTKREAYIKKMEEKAEIHRGKGELCCTESVQIAVQTYRETMDEHCSTGMPYLSRADLKESHEEAQQAALSSFKKNTAMFPEQRNEYENDVNGMLLKEYKHYKQMNELNNPRELPDAKTVNETITNQTVKKDNVPLPLRPFYWVGEKVKKFWNWLTN